MLQVNSDPVYLLPADAHANVSLTELNSQFSAIPQF